jgi:ornithine carbamoyltransferase
VGALARVPVINMESALWHPLQALADLMTLRETLGDLRGRRSRSRGRTRRRPRARPRSIRCSWPRCARAWTSRSRIRPGYELDEQVLADARALASEKGVRFATHGAPKEAAAGAHVVYARSWQSLEDYGNQTLAASRRSRSQGWIVDESLMRLGDDARLMHAMPVRRNLEVTDEVLDGRRSLVYEQAENRLHSQKALLVKLLRA